MLNMCSAYDSEDAAGASESAESRAPTAAGDRGSATDLSATEFSTSDLTAKARIRNGALALFGRHGVANTSVRAVAKAAGVSPALVIHHFGSKDELRRACDRYVIDDLLKKNEELANPDLVGTMRRWLEEPEKFRPALDYLARLIVDGSEAGGELFDEVVASTETMIAEGATAGTMNRAADSRMQAVLVAAFAMVPLLLERHVGRALGTDGLDAAAVQRMTIPTIELLTHGLYSDDTFLEAAKAALDGG